MKFVPVKITLIAFVAAGASAVLSAPAQALTGIDPAVAAGAGPKADKVWCGPYGCGGGGGYPYGGGYGWRPHPRPWGYGYGYGWRPRPWGGGWGGRPHYGGYGGGGW